MQRLKRGAVHTRRTAWRAVHTALFWQEVAILLVWTILTKMPEGIKEHVDPYILIGIGVVYTVCLLVMLRFTERWTARGASIFSTLQGDAVLYLVFGMLAIGLAWQPGTWLDLARACFVVGGPTLLVATLRWVQRKRREDRELERELEMEGTA